MTKKVLKTYQDKIKLFDFGQEILPNIKAIDATGHTPGHTAYEITSDGQKLMVVGDLFHVAPVQLPVPQLSGIFDIDQQKAAESRQRILDAAIRDGAIVAGMHFPMISPVRERECGGYVMQEAR